MERKFYHGSKNTTIKVLEPRVSTHGEAWVYATTNPILAAYFGGEVSDFNFILEVDETGIPQMYELYKGAFTECFKHKKSALYELKDSGFESGRTSFKYEYVSKKRTKIVKTVVINDLSLYLRKANRSGLLTIHFYENNREYDDMIRAHVRDRLVRFGFIHLPAEMLPAEVKDHWMEYYDVLREEMLKNQKYYIISSEADLKEFKPVSTSQDEAGVVTAFNNPILGMLVHFNQFKYAGTFGVKNTIDGIKPYFDGFFKNAFKEACDKESCYIYELENSGFTYSDKSSQEFVSPNETKVINMTKVEDMSSFFNEKIKTNELIIEPYIADAKAEKKNAQIVKEILLKEKKASGVLDENQLPKVVKEHFLDIVEDINKSKK